MEKGRLVIAAAVCCVTWAGPSWAISSSEFSTSSAGWQSGYVFGFMEYMSGAIDPDNPRDVAMVTGYRRCFQENKIDSGEGLRIVKRYLDRTPDASATPMLGNVIMAFRQACKRYMPK